MNARVKTFLDSRPVAVVGASSNRTKYGNIVLRNLRERGWEVYAVNPNESLIEGLPSYPTLADCPKRPELAVLVTQPAVSLKIVEQAHVSGVPRVWLQPGAEDETVLRRAGELGVDHVFDQCIMVMAARGGG